MIDVCLKSPIKGFFCLLTRFIFIGIIDAQAQTNGLIDSAIKEKTSGSQLLTLSNGEVAIIFP